MEKDGVQWIRMVFKGHKVWAETNATGGLKLSSGKVRIKYQMDQDYEYLVFPNALKPADGKTIEKSTHSLPAKKSPPKKVASPESASPPIETDIPENAIIIYTDGASSGNPGPSGIGVLLKYGGREKEISKYIGQGTNNIAELEAIRTALLELKKTDLPVRIYTDSNYALGLLSKGWKAKMNTELVAEIRDIIRRFKDIRFIKVEGHAGIEGNERADRLAVSAIEHRGTD